MMKRGHRSASTHTHTDAVRSQQAGVFLLWECETSPSYSLVPGGNGTEHLANQLQLSPPGLKVSPPTGMIYFQVESENKSLSVPLFFFFSGWVAEAWGSRLGKESKIKIKIYYTDLDWPFILFISHGDGSSSVQR